MSKKPTGVVTATTGRVDCKDAGDYGVGVLVLISHPCQKILRGASINPIC